MALQIDRVGMVLNSRVRPRRFLTIERAPLRQVTAIVLHQTDGSDANATFQGYRRDSLKISRSEIFRHPVVSWKNPDEARGARW